MAVTGVIFGAAYFLWYYERSMFGPLVEGVQGLADLNGREIVIALSLTIMIFWIGIYPAPFLNMMNGSVQAIVDRLDRGAVVAEAVSVNEAGQTGLATVPPSRHERRQALGVTAYDVTLPSKD